MRGCLSAPHSYFDNNRKLLVINIGEDRNSSRSFHIRDKRHHPVRIKSLLHILLFHPVLAHVSQAQVNSLSFRHISILFYIIQFFNFSALQFSESLICSSGSHHNLFVFQSNFISNQLKRAISFSPRLVVAIVP